MKKLHLFLFIILFLLISCDQAKKKTDIPSITHIGVISIIEHPLLEQARQGFKDTMLQNGYIEGDNIKYDYRNAYGKIDNANTIAAAFVGNNVDLIYGIATPTTQAVKQKTSSIPIVFAAVTDPVGAKLVKSLEHPGENVTGVSDMIPIRYQLETIKKVVPCIKKLGVPYNAGEANSVSLLNGMKSIAPTLDIEIVEATAASTAEVSQAISFLVNKIDALYMPTDNTMAAAVNVISDICMRNNIPFFSSENETIKNDGALASLSVDHYQLGVEAANMAVSILKNGAKPADIPVGYLHEYDLILNMRVASKLGLDISDDIKSKAILIQ